MAGNVNDRVRANMIRDLESMLALTNTVIGYEDQFMDCSGKWVTSRRKTLRVVDEFLDELGTIFKYTSKARAGGAGVGVLGGAAAAIGFGLKFHPNPAAKFVGDRMLTYGGGVAAIGGVTAGSACILESWLSQNTLDKIDDALREDKCQTMLCIPWYTRSRELEKLFRKVYGCSIVSNTRRDLFEAIEELRVICDLGGETLAQVIGALSRNGDQLFERGLNLKHVVGVVLHANDQTLLLLREFCTNPRVRQAVLSLQESLRSSPILFEIAKVACLMTAQTAVLEGAIQMLLPAGAQAALNAAGQLVQGALVAVTLAISVWSLILAVKDIKEGESKYTKMVKDVNQCLKCELDCLLERFPNLK